MQRDFSVAEATSRLFEEGPLPMWVYDPRTLSFLAVNDAAVECYGYSREEFLAMTVGQLHLPADLTARLEALLRAPVSAKQKAAWRHVRKDGSVIQVEVARSSVRVADESACLAVASDVSEGKRFELLCQMLLDAIPSSVLLLNDDLRVVLANRNFLEKSRQTAGQTTGKRLTEVFPEVIIAEMGLERQLRDVFRNNRAMHGQRLTYRTPGVPIRVYYYSVVPVIWGVRVDHVVLLMDDVTEQMQMGEEIRQMERQLASVVESASDIVLSTDTRGNILTWNKAAQRASGYSFEELKGRPFFEFCDEAGVRRFFSQAAPRDSSGMIECNLKTKDGKHRSVSWVFSQMTNDAGRTSGFVIVGRDLTERRKFEMQIQESQKLASLGVMARGIAHEIRTPLTVASSAAQFLAEGDLAPEFQRECAEKVSRGIRKASAIIENLLRFAHPTTNMNTTPVDILQVVKGALSVVGNQARVQKIEVRAHLPPEPCPILGVAGLLEQVFTNLFLNAMNAMPNGGTLDVSAERQTGDLLVHITDTGDGISPEDLGKIFDPFYTKAPPGMGTGLGLSICYSIVDQHKGSIGVDSEIGKGCTFTVRLPSLLPVEGVTR
ncbi:MAG: PAS domain S-box protein [Acidobacteria bacterium]|nr:PAS domain S-box protein [Acidobacteriota bacterium]